MSSRSRMASFAIAVVLIVLPLVVFGIYLAAMDVDTRNRLIAESTNHHFPKSRYLGAADGTIGRYFGSPEDVTIHGYIPVDVIVAQLQGRRISRISQSGDIVWSVTTRRSPRGLERHGNLMITVMGKEVMALDIEDGREVWRVDTGIVLNGLASTDEGLLVLPFLEAGPLYLLRLSDSGEVVQDLEARTEPIFRYPRHAIQFEGGFLVADTQAHQVVFRGLDGQVQTIAEAFYPNHLAIAGDEVWIAEEHANRILAVNLETGERRIVAGCPVSPFDDQSSFPERIENEELTTIKGFWIFRTSECAAEPGERSLYSPNGLALGAFGKLYVADTDNHRVVVFDKDGEIEAELHGFNNPIRVLPIEE